MLVAAVHLVRRIVGLLVLPRNALFFNKRGHHVAAAVPVERLANLDVIVAQVVLEGERAAVAVEARSVVPEAEELQHVAVIVEVLFERVFLRYQAWAADVDGAVVGFVGSEGIAAGLQRLVVPGGRGGIRRRVMVVVVLWRGGGVEGCRWCGCGQMIDKR